MAKRFSFLGSNRFWAVVVLAITAYIESKGWLGEAERNMMMTIAGLFVSVRTADRAMEYLGEKK